MKKLLEQILNEGMGKAYWIFKDGSMIDISGDMGGGTDDHVGFLATAYEKGLQDKFGVTEDEAQQLRDAYENGEGSEVFHYVQQKIFGAGVLRVRLYTGQAMIDSYDRTKDVVERVFSLIQKYNPKTIYWSTFKQGLDTNQEYTLEEFLALA